MKPGDVSGGDTWLMGTSSLYTFNAPLTCSAMRVSFLGRTDVVMMEPRSLTMRATAILLCLIAVAANAQQSRAPGEELLTPPPITSAPRDEEPRPAGAPAQAAHPEDEFIPPPFAPAPAAEPSPPPRAVAPPPSQAVQSQAAQPQPTLTPPARATVPARPANERLLRYSRYSAGAGGPTLVFTQGMVGVVTGAMLGSAFDIASDTRNSDGYTGAILGGLTLGTAATLYQYFIPVGRRESLLAAGAASTGFMASLAIASSRDLSDKDQSALVFASTQAGIIGVLLATAGGGDVSAGDAGLVGATSLYGFALTGLMEYIHSKETRQNYNFVPLLVAPAVGMAVGGLLAIPLELSASSTAQLTLYPLGTGLAALLIGSRFADDVVVAKTVLGTVGATFLIVALFNSLAGDVSEPPQKSASSFEAVPVPVVMTAGRGNDSLAAGPGLFLRF